jgi:N-acylneuraminate cytidylyltransferase/CMP-N,N'-diacetyllegionaminic acid synthase
MKRLCTICARGGSKGVKNKNLRPLAGRPLIAHSLEQARVSGLFEAIAVSSDSPAILEAGKTWGADELIERPADLAHDQADKAPAIRHALASVEARRNATFDLLVDLDATSPLRAVEDIRGAVTLLEDSGATSVITAAPARRSPYFNLVELDEDGHVRLCKTPDRAVGRRQDAPPCFDMNASIYVWRRDAFLADPQVFYPDTRLFVMPEERSHDIDSELDFAIVEFLMSRRQAA